MNFPSLENFWTRLLPSVPCPSTMKMSPLGANQNVGRAVELTRPVAGDPGLVETHELLAFGEDIEDLKQIRHERPRPISEVFDR